MSNFERDRVLRRHQIFEEKPRSGKMTNKPDKATMGLFI